MTLIDREHRPLITLNIHQGKTSLLGEFKWRATRGWRKEEREKQGGRKGRVKFSWLRRNDSWRIGNTDLSTRSMKDLLGLLNGQRSLSLSRSFFFPGHASGLSTIDIPSMCQCKQKFNLIVLRIVLPPLPPSLSPSSHWPRLLSPSLCSPIFNRGLIVSRLALNLHRFNQISPILVHGWKFDRRKNSLFFFFSFLTESRKRSLEDIHRIFG